LAKTPARKRYKPINFYAVAAGYYPIIPSSTHGSRGGTSSGFSIIKNYSKDYRNSGGGRPTMWKENSRGIKAYVQGNHIFSTRHRNVQNFKFGQKKGSVFLDRNVDKFISMRNQLAVKAKGMSLEMGKSMSRQLGGNYRKATASTLKVPASMGETHSTPTGGKTLGHSKPIDVKLDGKMMNITASALGQEGHGQYGSGRRRLQGILKKIDAEDLDTEKKNKAYVKAGLNYFKNRLPQWNAHIRYVRDKAGLNKTTKRATPAQKATMAKAFKNQGNVPGTMFQGLASLNQGAFDTGGHLWSGSKQMTAQHLGNPDLMYTGPGAWESMPVDDYTFASYGPFRLRQQGKDKFTYFEDIRGHTHRGYDMTVLFGNTLKSVMGAERAIVNKMRSFLTATHAGGSQTAARVNATNRVTHKEIQTATSLRPEVNLVQAGNAYNAAIDGMISKLKKSSRGVPKGVRSIVTKNRFKFARQGAEYTSIWAAPYISIFDVKSLGAGYDPK
tara:strand:- start:6697 stop:8193 length:1497 start_codon:yes stop_codon:yes gene_type:complete